MPDQITASPVYIEQNRIKKLLPEMALPPVGPVHPLSPTPLGIANPVGSIQPSKATKELFAPTRPLLTAPRTDFELTSAELLSKGHPLVGIILCFVRNEESFQLLVQIFDLEANASIERRNALEKKLAADFEELLKAQKDEKKWGAFESVFQYFIASSSVVIGAALIATGVGAPAGVAFIGVGALGFFNQGMTDAKGFEQIAKQLSDNKKVQEKTAEQLRVTAYLTFAVASIFAVWIGQTANLSSLVTYQRTMKALTVTGVACKSGSDIGTGISRDTTLGLRIKVTETRDGVEAASQELSEAVKRMSEQEEWRKLIADSVKKSIRNTAGL